MLPGQHDEWQLTTGHTLFPRIHSLDFDFTEPGLPNAMGDYNHIVLSNAMNICKADDYEASSQVFEKLLTNNPKNWILTENQEWKEQFIKQTSKHRKL